MSLVGRENEKNELLERYNSKDAEFVAIYGRRRVGKTYLVNQTFDDKFDFRHTGLSPIELKSSKESSESATYLRLQLDHFYHSLKLYGMKEEKKPKDWMEAFYMLEALLSSKGKDKRLLIFIDELPWMDTPKSLFLTAFESFWNGWANNENVLLIICGSATTWMFNKIINNKGGLYGRITSEMHISLLSLGETEELLKENHINFSRYDIAQTYMIFGGIPYYLKYLQKGKSLPMNIDHLFFSRGAILKDEFNRLFSSSFDDDVLVSQIVRELSKKKIGLTRDELAQKCDIKDGERFSKAINALLANDCILKYKPLQDEKQLYYKLVDPFCLFYLKFVDKHTSLDDTFFRDKVNSQTVVVWRGLAFENICYYHINTLKGILGISGIETSFSSFNCSGNKDKDGAQIDLVLIRDDDIVNLCEMKFYSDVYSQNKTDHLDLIRKKDVLSSFLKKKQHIHPILITTYGIKNTDYRWDYDNVVVLDDIFEYSK